MARSGNHGDGDDKFKEYASKPRGHSIIKFVNAAEVFGLLDAIADEGGAVRFGKSRDGGIVAIGIYGHRANPYTVYLRSGDDIVELLTDVADEMAASSVRQAHAKSILAQML